MKLFAFLGCFFAIAAAVIAVYAEPIPEGRIIDGNSGTKYQFPYQVAISGNSTTGSWWCGGSIIDRKWILTSADCIHGVSNLTVYFGGDDLENWIVRTILWPTYASVFVHPQFEPATLKNNIGLIRTGNVPFGSAINKIDLPGMGMLDEHSFVGERADFTGWGATQEHSGTHSSSLKYATYQVMSVESCQSLYGEFAANKDVICVVTPSKNGPCTGDSGNPLVVNDWGRQVQIGIMSFWRFQDCTLSPAAGLTRVSSYLSWINETMTAFKSI